MRFLRNFVKLVSPAVKTLLRVGKLSAILFTIIMLIVIIYSVCILLGGLVASHFGIVAGVLTAAIACFCVFVAILRELT
jgi:hypothetical protein